MFAGASRGGGGGGGGGKGGKFSVEELVEELYGISNNKRPKPAPATLLKTGTSKTRDSGSKGELTSQILEAARKLMDKRRTERYLRECGVSPTEGVAERTGMPYR
ncbi:homeobox protein Hox-D9-like [Huso huso]|uniref:Homeobox protein Hox-D9-like n=1 Tax=Huso huso TaxID=61971 RepID=A0ABR0Y1M2_HUSHU